MSSNISNEQLLAVYMGIKSDTGKLQVHCFSCPRRFTRLGDFKNHLELEHRIRPGQYGFIASARVQGSDQNLDMTYYPPVTSQSQRSGRIPGPGSATNPTNYGYNNAIMHQGHEFGATVQSPCQDQSIAAPPGRRPSAQAVTVNARQPSSAPNPSTRWPSNNPAISSRDDSVTLDLSSPESQGNTGNDGDFMGLY
ncbi:hypothetical protein F5Y02DRAFT_418116 [Annulohypoxylon stygium]|nr:hypothetical protein F5Y02DRAFT_418116 [Annulohypoxylon stygium]